MSLEFMIIIALLAIIAIPIVLIIASVLLQILLKVGYWFSVYILELFERYKLYSRYNLFGKK